MISILLLVEFHLTPHFFFGWNPIFAGKTPPLLLVEAGLGPFVSLHCQGGKVVLDNVPMEPLSLMLDSGGLVNIMWVNPKNNHHKVVPPFDTVQLVYNSNH